MSSSSSGSIEKRTETLDAIAAVLPLNRRGRLAGLLTDQDIETLRHLVNEGMGENTLRALTSDLAYLKAWSMAATGSPLPFPAPEALLLKLVAHHLWLPQQRENPIQSDVFAGDGHCGQARQSGSGSRQTAPAAPDRNSRYHHRQDAGPAPAKQTGCFR